jgi:hypothetical protein
MTGVCWLHDRCTSHDRCAVYDTRAAHGSVRVVQRAVGPGVRCNCTLRPQVGEDQRAVLRKAGYSIYERSVPVTSADIAPGALKEARRAARHRRRALRGRDATRGWHATCNVALQQVDDSGCCGIHEMLKIEAPPAHTRAAHASSHTHARLLHADGTCSYIAARRLRHHSGECGMRWAMCVHTAERSHRWHCSEGANRVPRRRRTR